MKKGPVDPKEIFSEIINDYKELFGQDLVSIILYGSATGQNYRPGKSDINFMVVLTEDGIKKLDRAFAMVKKWRKKNVAVPLFLTEPYVDASLDVFPIEYLTFQRNHLLVFGKDILKDLKIEPKFLRLQCEREIKGKLLLLREAFLESEGRGKTLIGVITRSVQAFLSIFEALLHLEGIDPPREKRKIAEVSCKTFGLEPSLFNLLLDIREEKTQHGETRIKEIFKNYLEEISRLSKLVDRLGG